MSTEKLNDDQLVDTIRQVEATQTSAVSSSLWDRVQANLPQEEGLEHLDAVQPKRPQLRVVHSSVRRMRRLAAVAAVLLAVFGLTWYLATQEDVGGQLVTQEALQRDLDRQALEGPLELDGESRPLGRDLYRGVAVKEGTLSTDVIRACNPC